MSCRLDKTGDNLVGDSKPLGQITLERRGLSPIFCHADPTKPEPNYGKPCVPSIGSYAGKPRMICLYCGSVLG